VVTAGPGAKNTLLGCLNFSWYDVKRARYKQAGRGGIGTVFADKGIRALVARWDTVTADTNNPADKTALKSVAKLHSREIVELDPKRKKKNRKNRKKRDRYFILDTYNFMCNVGQKYSYKGAKHAQNSAIDYK
jgi:aldehyde:ferredoxin oxidoreductase